MVYIDRHIVPMLGNTQARKLDVETLDRYYARLRAIGGKHGGPMPASSVRQIHFILRAAYRLAVKWGTLTENPAMLASPPRFTRVEVRPPTVDEVRRLLDTAEQRSPAFATLLWVAMITGARRGELCALRWPHVRPDLADHKQRCQTRAQKCGTQLREDGYVFAAEVDGSQPLAPNSVTPTTRTVQARAREGQAGAEAPRSAGGSEGDARKTSPTPGAVIRRRAEFPGADPCRLNRCR